MKSYQFYDFSIKDAIITVWLISARTTYIQLCMYIRLSEYRVSILLIPNSSGNVACILHRKLRNEVYTKANTYPSLYVLRNQPMITLLMMRINISILIVPRMFMITLLWGFRIYRASKSNDTREHYSEIHICIIFEAF